MTKIKETLVVLVKKISVFIGGFFMILANIAINVAAAVYSLEFSEGFLNYSAFLGYCGAITIVGVETFKQVASLWLGRNLERKERDESV